MHCTAQYGQVVRTTRGPGDGREGAVMRLSLRESLQSVKIKFDQTDKKLDHLAQDI
ncbi:hypothetical protein BOO71_0004711 [Deinococcus marmoris]|uniref:Uncharacterized protein n=1 Tax=Deinococcus marmoris TaxID=249408 RepID=A0A1U7P0U5_9DEIO|nr:hypothetical protein BOO71_0004711 [Deinococcus marmoris]